MRGNKVVLDLEFTPVRDPDLQLVAKNEILEIGAIKLDETNHILGEFQTYVKPQYSTIPPHITRMTGISAKTVQEAPEYSTAMQMFSHWIGEEAPTRFYTWSDSDRRVLLQEADLKEQLLADMFYAHWVDLQRIYRWFYPFERLMSLTNALGTMQIFFSGTEHGALADARNTAKILKSMSSIQQMREQIGKSHITYNNTESHGFTMNMVFKKK